MLRFCALLLATVAVRACDFDTAVAATFVGQEPPTTTCAQAVANYGGLQAICNPGYGELHNWLAYACSTTCGEIRKVFYAAYGAGDVDNNDVYKQVYFTDPSSLQQFFGGIYAGYNGGGAFTPASLNYYSDDDPARAGVQSLYTCQQNFAQVPANQVAAFCQGRSGSLLALVCAATYKANCNCPTCVVPSPTAGSCLGLQGDPHLKFANGGEADFRGRDKTLFALATAQNFQTNVMIEERTFVRWGGQIVHGSFVTQVYIKMRTKTGDVVRIGVLANQFPSFRVYGEDGESYVNKTTHVVDGLAAVQMNGGLGQTCRWCFFMRGAGWEVTVNHRRVRKPLVSGKEADRADRNTRAFLDTSFKVFTSKEDREKYSASTLDRIAPHGILAQGFDGSKIAVSGKMDKYGDAPEFTTSAQAEGAIEGVWTDYIMPTKFETEFKFARFDATELIAPRNASALGGLKFTATSDGKSAGTVELHGVEPVEQM